MVIFNSVSGFDWDEGNLTKNWEKHGVTPFECEEVFFNEPLIVGNDEKHSEYERRYYALGRTDKDRHLFVAFTIRGDKIRIISVRDMGKKERKIYHEKS